VIHYETVQIPPGRQIRAGEISDEFPCPSHDACSIYALRIEANYQPADMNANPVEVTFAWKEGDKERSHTQLIEKLPFKYTINVGGEDHPTMESLTINLKGSRPRQRQIRLLPRH
jgi:hypothetical protein